MGVNRNLVLSKKSAGLPVSLFQAESNFFDDAIIITDELVSETEKFKEILSVNPSISSNYVSVSPKRSELIDSGDKRDLKREESIVETESTNQIQNENGEEAFKKYSCHSCGVVFDSLSDQRFHFKTDWHRFNVKRKLTNKTPLSEDEFDAKIKKKFQIQINHSLPPNAENQNETSNETSNQTSNQNQNRIQNKKIVSDESDLSSISGSESSDDETKSNQKLKINSEASREISFSLNRSPKVLIYLKSKNVFVSLWRVLIFDKPFDNADVVLQNLKNMTRVKSLKAPSKQESDNSPVWILLLSSGGHFAAIVVNFENGQVIDHQTFHRYVVRAKAGGRQSTKDSKSVAKSAGSSLRRYNELALQKEIKELIYSWRHHFSKAHFIFIHSPSPSSSQDLFNEGEANYPLKKKDARIKKIPFPIQRPTFKQACHVAVNLASLHYENDYINAHINGAMKGCDNRDGVKLSQSNGKDMEKERRGEDKKGMEEEDEKEERGNENGEFFVSNDGKREKEEEGECRMTVEEKNKETEKNGSKEKDENKEDEEEEKKECMEAGMKEEEEKKINNNKEEKKKDQNLNVYELHVAASSGNEKRVKELLEEGCHDPALKDKNGKTAYSLSATQPIKNIFRKHMTLFPLQWDWKKAGVFLLLNDEIEKEELEKKAEKEARKKAKEKEKRGKRKEALKLQKEKEEAEKLLITKEIVNEVENEREKRARAAEKRLQHSNSISISVGKKQALHNVAGKNYDIMKCNCCDILLQGKIPFYRLSYCYCSTTCVRVHKEKLEQD